MVDPTVETTPATDCYIDSAAPTTSFCGASSLYVGSTSTARRRTLLKFNLTGVPLDAKVVGARLSLWRASQTTANAKQVGVYSAARAWTSSVTWNAASTGTPWQSPGGDLAGARLANRINDGSSSSGGYWELDVTGAVKSWAEGTADNHGFLLKDENPTVSNVLGFRSSEYGTATTPPYERPRLLVDWQPRTGYEPQYSYAAEQSGDRVRASVNLGNGNLIAYVQGMVRRSALDLEVSHYYNSLGIVDRWTDTAGPSVHLFRSGHRVFHDGTGAAFPIVRNDTTGVWESDPALAADLVTVPEETIRYDDGISLTFVADTDTPLKRKTNVAGDAIDYEHDMIDSGVDYAQLKGIVDSDRQRHVVSSSRHDLTGLTDPEGRRHVWRWSSATPTDQATRLLEHVLPGGAVDRFTYGAPGNQLIRLAPADGPAIKLAYDAQNRVTSMTLVTDAAADSGPTTTFAYAASSTPCDPARHIRTTTVTAPGGGQTAYCIDRVLGAVPVNGDTVAPVVEIQGTLYDDRTFAFPPGSTISHWPPTTPRLAARRWITSRSRSTAPRCSGRRRSRAAEERTATSTRTTSCWTRPRSRAGI